MVRLIYSFPMFGDPIPFIIPVWAVVFYPMPWDPSFLRNLGNGTIINGGLVGLTRLDLVIIGPWGLK